VDPIKFSIKYTIPHFDSKDIPLSYVSTSTTGEMGVVESALVIASRCTGDSNTAAAAVAEVPFSFLFF